MTALGQAVLAAFDPSLSWTLYGRLHPLVVHFPIALLIAAAGAGWIWAIFRKSPGWEGAMRWCLWLGVLGAIFSVTSGWIRADEKGYAEQTVSLHRWLAVSTAVVALLTLIVYEIGRLKDCNISRWLTRLGLLVTMVLVGWAGHEGGILIYGEDYFSGARPDEYDPDSAEVDYAAAVRPIFEEYCFRCHQGLGAGGGVDLVALEGKTDLAKDPQVTGVMLQVLVENRMPPKGQPQPGKGQMQTAIAFAADAVDLLASQKGMQLPPRDDPEAYYAKVRELTGVNIDPSDSAPVILEPEEQEIPITARESIYDSEFVTEIKPLLGQYCLTCHSGSHPKGEIHLDNIERVSDLQQDGRRLEKMILVVENDRMPPELSPQPSLERRRELLEFLVNVREEIAQLRADMPGPVTMPRLNPDQYDNVIRDLTGVDIQPARQFPREGGGGEGFSNVGDAMSTTPQLTRKFLTASRDILQHCRITPIQGLNWASNPLPEFISPEELRYYVVRRRVGWLNVQNDYYANRLLGRLEEELGLRHGAYFEAAWLYRYRNETVRLKGADFRKVANEYSLRLHPVSLEKWYDLLSDESLKGVLGTFAKKWRALPAPGKIETHELRRIFAGFDSVFDRLRPGSREPYRIDRSHRPDRRAKTPEEKTFQERLAKGCYEYIIDTSEFKELFLIASPAYDGNEGDYVVWKNGRVKLADGSEKSVSQVGKLQTPQAEPVAWGTHPVKDAKIDAGAVAVHAPAALKLLLPKEAQELRIDACVDLDLPDADQAGVQTLIDTELPEDGLELLRQRWFYGPEGSEKVKDLFEVGEKLKEMLESRIKGGAQAKADFWFWGWDKVDPKYIGGPWNENLQLRAGKANQGEPEQMYYYTFDQIINGATPEAREELEKIDRDIVLLAQVPQQDMLAFLRKQGLEEIDEGILPPATVVRSWDEDTRKEYDKLLQAYQEHEALLADHAKKLILNFARRAWRKDVSSEKLDELMQYYHQQRSKGRNFEVAVRLPLRVVLVSPQFVFLVQQSKGSHEPYALSDYELATRLSFFLWASVPDEELLDLAEKGQLQESDILVRQVHRMLKDPRSRALGSQFAAQWLGFANFDQYNTPDQELFPEFTESLRKAMFEESVLFFQELFGQDRSVRDLWLAEYAFLNEELAGHYGIEGVEGDQMRRVEIPQQQRGGVIAMGSILTRTSTALRTSPVLRGNWVTGALMGTPVGEPPPNVPPISDEETNPEGLTVAEQLKLHRKLPGCASCHDIMDPPGMSLENFDPIGRWRQSYRAGNEVQAVGVTKTGREIAGFAGFRKFCNDNEDKIVRQFCRKLTGYALGRALQPGDEPLIQNMMASLEEDDYAATTVLEMIVASRQFRYRQDLQAHSARTDAPQPGASSNEPDE